MPVSVQGAAVVLAIALTACAKPPAAHVVYQPSACLDRATNAIAQDVPAIRAHRYAAASGAAERAARLALSCGRNAARAEQMQARWHAANALVLSAELAHQAGDQARARRLLHTGYTLLYAVRPLRTGAPTSALLAQKLDVARRDLQGQWSYW